MVKGAPAGGGDAEPGDPALILDTELTCAVDARLAEDDGLQAVDAGVVADVLVAGPLGAAVGAVEVQRLALVDALRQVLVGVAAAALDDLHVFEIPIHFIRGAVEDGRAGPGGADGLQDVEGPQGVDLEVVAGVLDAGGDGDLGGEVEDAVGVGVAADGVGHRGGVADVGLDEVGDPPLAEPGEVRLRPPAAEVVDDDDVMPLLVQPRRGVAADEPGAPGDDPLLSRRVGHGPFASPLEIGHPGGCPGPRRPAPRGVHLSTTRDGISSAGGRGAGAGRGNSRHESRPAAHDSLAGLLSPPARFAAPGRSTDQDVGMKSRRPGLPRPGAGS